MSSLFETERFPLSEAENERDNPSRTVPLVLGRFEQLLNLEHKVGLDFVLDRLWSLGQLSWISNKVATAHGLVQCGSNGPMHLMDTTRTQQGAMPRSDLEHCYVQPLDILGSQRCEAMPPDARYEMDTDGSPIALIRALLHDGT